jgi:uncharacterized repeat protein (TIGR01451 family)
LQQWYPLSPGAHYFQGIFDEVWKKIGLQAAFPDTCRCGDPSRFDPYDNGAGLSWDISLEPSQSETGSHLTRFSPQKPLRTTETPDTAIVYALLSRANGYTVVVSNPNFGPVKLVSVSDVLPPGFTYTPGPTTGATTAEPTVSDQKLTWPGPLTVPGSGDITLHFNVTIGPPDDPPEGTFYNNAFADGGAAVVFPTGNTAAVTVTMVCPPDRETPCPGSPEP